ncbi:unnamed protein product [Diabrotica balteata]|uniref:protein-serine/threonine phosphatase n=1 Tax=Diabrotica balteata TaxID=107213 RepID=A0A9N9XAT7_DIABA|nr:unnamed protein product [Diabrotica balteata]
MGSYLSEPVTNKVSTDESNDKLSCGSSSMQGWRITQEDAHNHILDFDTNTSLFAVYDGHGGHEVAQYCSQKLPQFIKDTQAYKDGDIMQALIQGFLEFDATIPTKDVVAVLKEIAGEKEGDEESDEEENVDHLYEEACMPIEKVIEKYTNLVNPALKNLKKDGDKYPKSPNLKSKQEDVGVHLGPQQFQIKHLRMILETLRMPLGPALRRNLPKAAAIFLETIIQKTAITEIINQSGLKRKVNFAVTDNS